MVTKGKIRSDVELGTRPKVQGCSALEPAVKHEASYSKARRANRDWSLHCFSVQGPSGRSRGEQGGMGDWNRTVGNRENGARLERPVMPPFVFLFTVLFVFPFVCLDVFPGVWTNRTGGPEQGGNKRWVQWLRRPRAAGRWDGCGAWGTY